MQSNSMSSYAPLYINEILQMSEIYKVQDFYLKELQNLALQKLNGNFVMTSNEHFVKRYEKLLNIVPYSQNNLEERKKRIIALLSLKYPITLMGLENKINLIFPESNCNLIYHSGQYLLTVKINPMPLSQIIILHDLLNQSLPANIIYTFSVSSPQELKPVISSHLLYRYSITIYPQT